jgi:hypothetical protein
MKYVLKQTKLKTILKAIYHILYIIFIIFLFIFDMLILKIYLAVVVDQQTPTIECQPANREMNTIQAIAYLSKLVKYDTVGNDLFMIHLNETEVNNRV